MTRTLLVARREMLAYVRSPIAAAIIAAALLIDGILFYKDALSAKLLTGEALAAFFYNASGLTMISGILLSMRLIAEERQNSTITLLSTSPLRDRDIILGKFLAAFVMITVLTLLTLYMPALLFVNGKVSVGHIAVGYGGLLLMGAASVSVGLFASSLTRSQVVAGIVAAALLGVLILMWVLAKATDPPIQGFLMGLAFHHTNWQPFQLGILRLQSVAYYVAVTYFFLLGSVKIMEARRWR